MSRNVLEQVRDALMACNAISSNREFCHKWLAKDESYMRGLRFRDLDPSADALATCASKLGYYAQRLSNSTEQRHRHWADRFQELHDQCQQALEEQARAKWQSRSGALQ
jgi:2-succinyl-5-enolpyruvyl-6-hydroxy-3-cyclohexene-1-carboxylate synthase